MHDVAAHACGLLGYGFNDKIGKSYWATGNKVAEEMELTHLWTAEMTFSLWYDGTAAKLTFAGDDDTWVAVIHWDALIFLGG